MDYLYLQALMHGEIDVKGKPKKVEKEKKPVEIELEKQIESYVQAADIKEDLGHAQLLSSEQIRNKMKFEISEAFKLTEFSQQIELAMKILFSESVEYLSKETHSRLLSELEAAEEHLAEINLEKATQGNLQTIAEISDDTMQSIADIGIAKFAEERYFDCLALFSLLSILDPSYSEYWLRQGVAAQKCEKFELAARSYAAASELDPELITSRLLAVQCYIKCDQLEQAKAEFNAAKRISEGKELDPEVRDLLKSTAGLLHPKT